MIGARVGNRGANGRQASRKEGCCEIIVVVVEARTLFQFRSTLSRVYFNADSFPDTEWVQWCVVDAVIRSVTLIFCAILPSP